jgi:acetyl-CoA carboxylase biotin carboxyl carrier protein
MEFNDIKQLASLMKEMGLTSLEFSAGGASIRMERAASSCPPAASGGPAEDGKDLQTDDGGIYTVTSPMVGVFYASPAPDKRPFVSVGDRVNAGDVLCIIEAMKMMNEIAAEKSGVITEICVGNKQIVEYGHPLFRIRTE